MAHLPLEPTKATVVPLSMFTVRFVYTGSSGRDGYVNDTASITKLPPLLVCDEGEGEGDDEGKLLPHLVMIQ